MMAWSLIRDTIKMFLFTITVCLFLRIIFGTFLPDSLKVIEDSEEMTSEYVSIGNSPDSQQEIRLFTFSIVDSKQTTTSIGSLIDTVLYRDKNNSYDTLLKTTNMSHVNEIIKKLKAFSLNFANVPNPHPFKYIINNPNICGKDQVFMLVYIHTAPDHHKQRNVIRQTWGNISLYNIPVRLAFFSGVAALGENATNLTIQHALQMESDLHGDIVQEDFLDSYHNLTYKGIAALKWIENYCSQAIYILKTDDDIFVNTYSLLKHLQSMAKNPSNTRGLLMCAVWHGMQVMRDGKWKVTKEEYANDTYPAYCSGSAFILTTDVAITLYRVSYHVPFFWVDDVYITGFLPLKAGNVSLVSILPTYVIDGSKFRKKFTGSDWYLYIFSHVHDLKKFRNVWKTVSNRSQGYAEYPPLFKIANVSGDRIRV